MKTDQFIWTTSLLPRRTVQLVKNIIERSDIQVIEQSHKSFLLGLSLYENRLYKGYSLTDCISIEYDERVRN